MLKIIEQKISACLVAIYGFWHGRLRLRGMGKILFLCAKILPALRNYPLTITGVGVVRLDFRDTSAFCWMNQCLNDPVIEHGLLEFTCKHFANDGVFWDVGANIGVVSGNLFKRFSKARFCLFEPNEALVKRLRGLFDPAPNVLVSAIALSDQTGEAFLGGGADSTTNSVSSVAGKNFSRVALSTGDIFLQHHQGFIPTVVKIDVEGHELQVLAGCAELIKKYRPIIIFEHLFLKSLEIEKNIPDGYALFYLHDHTGELMPSLEPAVSHNAVLMPVNSGMRGTTATRR